MLYDRLLFISAERMSSPTEVRYAERLAPQSALMVYMVKGRADARSDYDRWELHDGETLLISERADFTLTSEADADYYIIRFAADFEDEPPFVVRRPDEYEAADPKQNERINGLLTELCRISQSLDYPEEACDYLLRLLVIELGRKPHTTDAEELYPRILAYLEENAGTDLTVAGISKHFGYSPDHLARSFKEYCGRGLKSAIDAARLTFIRSQLTNPDLSNAQLAEKCGFRNYKALAEFFKYNTGMSMAAYRKGIK